MEQKLGTYFLGATVATHQAINRFEQYTDLIATSFGKDVSKKNMEWHITVIPPFTATYTTASEINMGATYATLLQFHPINDTLFSVKGLDLMGFEGEEFLHFPIVAHTTRKETWAAYVARVRKSLSEAGIKLRGKIPAEYRAHVTIFRGKNLSRDREVLRVIQRSRQERALYFKASFLTMYAKYRHGWDTLSHDPALE